MNKIKRCKQCKKWFAMKLKEKTVVKIEEIKVSERLFKHDPRGGVEPALDHFAPGERIYYDICYVCKYCGNEEKESKYEDVKKIR